MFRERGGTHLAHELLGSLLHLNRKGGREKERRFRDAEVDRPLLGFVRQAEQLVVPLGVKSALNRARISGCMPSEYQKIRARCLFFVAAACTAERRAFEAAPYAYLRAQVRTPLL
jgi:hypothetical protein